MKITPTTPPQRNVWQRRRPTNEELLARFDHDMRTQFKRKKTKPSQHQREE